MFTVQKTKCNQCLFTNNRIVSIKRMKEILKDCKKRDSYFVCHKDQTVGEGNGKLCCRGFLDNFKNDFNLGRMIQRINYIKEVEIGDEKQKRNT